MPVPSTTKSWSDFPFMTFIILGRTLLADNLVITSYDGSSTLTDGPKFQLAGCASYCCLWKINNYNEAKKQICGRVPSLLRLRLRSCAHIPRHDRHDELLETRCQIRGWVAYLNRTQQFGQVLINFWARRQAQYCNRTMQLRNSWSLYKKALRWEDQRGPNLEDIFADCRGDSMPT